MIIRAYCWEHYYTYNFLYRALHPDSPGYEHKFGVSRIEIEYDNGAIFNYSPLTNEYFNATSVKAVVFQCKTCKSNHFMIKEDSVPTTQIHFNTPCKCGNIGVDYFKPNGCLTCNTNLPIYEKTLKYERNRIQGKTVEKIMDEQTYENTINSIFQCIQGKQ